MSRIKVPTLDVTTGRVPAAQVGGLSVWAPSAPYKANEIVVYQGALYQAKADFTSAASFDATKWNALSSGGGATLTDQSVLTRYASDALRTGGWLPAGAIDETLPGRTAGSGTGGLTSGQLRVAGGIVIPGGRAVSSITFVSGTTAGAGLTHQWFCLIDRVSLAVLATTIDDAANAWGANTAKTLQLATAIGGATPGGTYTPTNAVEAYVGICVTGTTTPTLINTGIVAQLAGLAPIIAGTANTGLTDPASLPTPITAPAQSGTFPYAYIS